MSFESIQLAYPSLFNWIYQHGIRILMILAAALILDLFLRNLVNKKSFGLPVIGGKIKKHYEERVSAAQKQRVGTIVNVLGGALTFMVYAIALLMVLPELGINIEPLLAGILAVGIASKDILADFINGLIILAEDQYNIGDSVSVAGVSGIVKEITLRRTVIEESGGVWHIIPNREIKVVTRQPSAQII